MSKKPFLAGEWLSGDLSTAKDWSASNLSRALPDARVPQQDKSKFPSFLNRRRPQRAQVESAVAQGFCPASYLVPGWTGSSLTTHHANRYVKLLEALRDDVRRRLSTHEFNRSLKLGIYNEFICYAHDKGLHTPGLEEVAGLWQAIKLEPEARPAELNTFLDLYCSRVAVITLFKLRFIRVLSKTSGVEAGAKAAHNPNHWLSQVFQAGTKRELKARIMESSVFSWYRPGDEMAPGLVAWMSDHNGLCITELIKHTSPRVQESSNRVYSHALSHINFGLFLNSLLINFTLWMETWDPSPVPKFHTPDEMEIISCKYSGEFLESLSHSHWLAQDNNKEMKWDQILCPDFKGKEFEAGPFMKMLNELQFLTFLAEVAELQGQAPVDFIAKIMSGHYQNRKGTKSSSRTNLGNFDAAFLDSTYDRVVLNLTQLPKNNPYHWILGQIDSETKNLKPGATMFVLTSKNLFAPSQKDRLAQVLEGLELKAVFELEQLKGKGELGSWLYVFRRRASQMAPISADKRESVAWFRFTGEMNSFQDFVEITEVLRTFYLSHLGDVPALWHQEWSNGFRLEFFQDALINGHLIHSAHEDQTRVTHPRFFKNLLSTSVPLDSVFDLRQIDPEEWSSPGSNGLGIGPLRCGGATFLVVDFRDPAGVTAELFPADTFRSVYYERGASQCHYFLVASRHQGMDPNVLRKYFASTVGRQLLGLSFAGGTKVKGQLGKMLVPQWFLRGEFMPESLQTALELFRWDTEKLNATHPEELNARFRQFKQISGNLFPRYACDVMGALVSFERTLGQLIEHMNDPRMGTKINFFNPLIQKPLSKLESHAVFPRHPDVFTDYVPGVGQDDLALPLTKVELRGQVEGDLKTWFLEVFNSQGPVMRLHSDEEMLLLAQFILQNALGVELGKIVRALRLPRLSELKDIVGHTIQQRRVFTTLNQEAQQFMDDCFRLQFMGGDLQ